MNHLGFGTGPDRLVGDFSGGIQVILKKMPGGDQTLTDVVEAFGRVVGREGDGGIEIHHLQVEQIPNGVEVFDSVKAAEDDLPSVFPGILSCLIKNFGEVGDNPPGFLRLGLLFVFRRHLGQVELIENFL